jgi:DNA-binding XRE family transcriptional regulator
VNKETIIQLVSEHFKLVRTEFDYHQEEMANILGISKKTLVQIEKGRQTASWIQVISLCSIFQNSNILQNALGGDPIEVIQTIARSHYDWKRPRTMGGKVWWIEKEKKNGFILQKNMITNHYRILDDQDERWYRSWDEAYIRERFEELTKEK